MSKKLTITDPFQPKITRNDRFAQMSHQEKVIEQKKREIQAKLEAKQKGNAENTIKASSPTPANKQTKSPPKKTDIKKTPGFNLFSNDGSFLDTFKQMKEKKIDSKLKSFKTKDSLNDRSGTNKNSRWSQRRRSPSPKDRNLKSRISRFSEKPPNFEPKITINTSFNNPVSQQNYDSTPQVSISPQNVTGQPLLKNILPPPGVVFPQSTQSSAPVIAAPPLLLNVPPPQIVPSQVNNTLLLPSSGGNVLVSTPTVSVTIPASGVLTTVTLPPPSIISTQPVTVSTANAIPVPPPCVPAVELASIPPPNPIQVQNIPQPEPINTMNIPHPAPIQVQNIPTPTSIQLNDIPNPKPLDLLAIPTPNEDKSISDPDFIKNIPPPNKSIPPPSLPEPNVNVSVPPPNTPVQSTCLPPPNIIPVSIPPPQSITTPLPQNLTVQSIAPCQNILVHAIPPPQTVQPLQTIQSIPNQGVPPPNLQNQNNFASVSSISVALPVGVVPSSPVTVTNTIPSLMAQPILPPPGMGVATVNVNCPPPLLPTLQAPPPPSYVNQPPPLTNQMPPMNVPPPNTTMTMINTGAITGAQFRDVNAVFPPGTPDYEAMASLGRMVAQCGPGIEDVVRQRKTQDPNLWFLFHKESAAYQQYHQLVEQFKREINAKSESLDIKDKVYKPEDIYEPEMAIEDDDCNSINQDKKTEMNVKENDGENTNKRKRKSRWGDKDLSIAPPIVLNANQTTLPRSTGVSLSQQQSGVMISKITRTDPGLIQYTINTYGSTNLSEEEWKKAEDNYKINILYQDMMKKREELEKLQQSGKNKYDYDSDEDIEGGTWEHKLRDKEMMATQLWAQELTRQAEGKHHIGDFLPPEELKRFMEKAIPGKERVGNNSDYKDFTIKEDNIGYKMLQKLGWSQGQGLGSNGAGIVEPINKATQRDQNQGLGLGESEEDKEDEYEAYRKRMMLAYRFRPNPLNNPRRPYY